MDDAAHDAVAAEVRQLEHGGRPERAAWVARRWLAQDPSDARRWVLFAETVPSGARPLFEEALRLDRGSAAPWTGLAREDLAAGDVPGATAALRAAIAADPGATDPHLLLAELEHDVPKALAWWMAGPREAERALLVARLEPALADSVLAGAPGAEAAAARAARALGRGDVGAARLELPAAPPATGDRLAGWARCLEAGTATAEVFAQFEALRAEALVHPAAPPDPAPALAHAPGCAAALGLAATATLRSSPPDAVTWARRASELEPGDDAWRVLLGEALLQARRPVEARAVFDEVAPRRPGDPRVVVGRARAAVASRDWPGARAVLAEAAGSSPESAELALTAADAARTSTDALDVLLAALSAGWHPAVEDRARELAAGLGRSAEVVAAAAPPPVRAVAGGLPDGVEEVVVQARPTTADALATLVARIQEIGYKPPERTADGTVRLESGELSRPWIELHPDGLVSMDEVLSGEDMDDPQKGLPQPVSGVLGRLSKNTTGRYRTNVFLAIAPELAAWREALCAEGLEDRLVTEVPATLDAVWAQGVGRDGRELVDPAARRAELLDWWATRTCNPEGNAVRAVIARYLAQVVQRSSAPVTPAELDAANARRLCAEPLAL